MMKGLLTIFVAGILVGSMSIKVQSVADQFFDEIIGQSDPSCAWRNFYARAAFLEALDEFPEFGTADDIEREIVAFFAHVTHETGRMIFLFLL
ncbi:hypothetical protein HRI_000857300 [Hibiscus trionum]|uniref:Glycoside hydrolase family 19 catalytic domain-containing protein n=1 Tax=Hibiscus trionum TaxID=183268 RepID=A0A9W7H6I4_HIBTR|nr:hypothetical protein HRI_000857300 [Hibiscus trionum]